MAPTSVPSVWLAGCLLPGVILVVATTFCALYLERIGMRALEAVFFALLGTMAGTFGFLFFTAGVDYGEVAKGDLPVPGH